MVPISPGASISQSRASTTTAHSNNSEHKGASSGHDAHESHYDPPGGWLWGLRPGEKYEKEGWEGLAYWGFWGSFVVAGVAYAFKEDTS
jgi:ESSS subunit of NADH:ubiquinone oxidoreductase (complex I)